MPGWWAATTCRASPGAGQEFLDHRNFHHGDDLRAVNWRAYLRLEKLFLKMFQVEPRVPVRMLLDLSDSMMAHGGQKFDYARKLAAALCYVGLVRLDTIEVHGFSDRLAQRIFSTGGRHRFPGVMDGLAALKAGGATDYMAVVREFIGAYSQRGLVIVISDFLDDSGCERALQYLADFGHELMLLQVWADEDRIAAVDRRTGTARRRDRRRPEAGFRRRRARGAILAPSTNTARRFRPWRMRSGGRYAGIATSQSLESVIFGDLIRVQGIA